jgi:hypothetical protein
MNSNIAGGMENKLTLFVSCYRVLTNGKHKWGVIVRIK